MRVTLLAVFSSFCLVASAAGLDVAFDDARGGIRSIRVAGDPEGMNWVEGTGEWGVPSPEMNLRFVTAETRGKVQTATWTNRLLRLDVRREVHRDSLSERYTFSALGAPVAFGRGDIGIFVPFNDSYEGAETCLGKRCHAHVWCGGAFGGVRALKMGPFPLELGLFLTDGTLDAYSVRRIAARMSNDRGDIILHPEPFSLSPGASRTIAWKLSLYRAGDFAEAALASGPAAALVEFENETIFEGECFRVAVTCAEDVVDCSVSMNGKPVPAKVEGRAVRVDVRPDFLGAADFIFSINGRRHRARGWVSENFPLLVSKRIETILAENQCLDARSPLYGAFVPFDNEDGVQRFDVSRPNHDATRERVGMALLIARWARRHPDGKLLEALSLYERFLLREVFDGDTGRVWNGIGKSERRPRHYNAPWYIMFWHEMYSLTGEGRYLDFMARGMLDWFSRAGETFYPIACNFAECVAALEKAGRDVSALRRLLRRQVDAILARGRGYPSQEVSFEQTLVTTPVELLAGHLRSLGGDGSMLSALSNHVDVLTRFDGHAPDHRLGGVPIRHWDDYWFGKRALFGDTMPHYWSCLSAHGYVMYAALAGDVACRRRAERIYRNMLCLFSPSGKASCAYVNPFSVTMTDVAGKALGAARRGEFFDPLANDQDFGLYFALADGAFDGLEPWALKSCDWTVECIGGKDANAVPVYRALSGATIRGTWEAVPDDISSVWDGNFRWCHFNRKTVANRVVPTSYARVRWRPGMRLKVAARDPSKALKTLPWAGPLAVDGTGSITLEPKGPAKLMVSADGDVIANALSLFVESAPARPDFTEWRNVIRFGEGLHTAENDSRIVLNSHGMPVVAGIGDGTLVWFDEGARVCAAIDVCGAKRVRIAGNGTIDLLSRSQGFASGFEGVKLWGVCKDWELPAIYIHGNAEDVTVENLTMLCSFRGVCVRNAKRLSFRDLKIFTHACSGDGINMVNIQGLTARDLFIHSQDDCFCAYNNYDSIRYLWDGDGAVKERRSGDVLLEDSFLWTACRPLVFAGHGTNSRDHDILENVTVRRCVVVPTMGCAEPSQKPVEPGSGIFRIPSQGNQLVRHLLFDDIEIDWTPGFRSKLFHVMVRSRKTGLYGEDDGYRIEDVLFRNIRCLGVPGDVAASVRECHLEKPPAGAGVFDVRAENVTYDGVAVDPFAGDFLRKGAAQ